MIYGESFAEVYEKLVREIMEHGKEVKPRGMATKELEACQFCIGNPARNLALIPERKFNLMHAIAESMLLFTKENDVRAYTLMNKNMENYSDDGETLHGAYGYRIARGFEQVVEKLRKDPDSRQAVLQIYDTEDLWFNTKDVPCTMNLHFLIRDGKLDLHVYMRSNDAIWGTPYDVFVFTTAQMAVANSLRIPAGKYYHTATSLHIYENMYEMAEKIIANGCTSIEHYNMNTAEIMSHMGVYYAEYAKHRTDNALRGLINTDSDRTYSAAVIAELSYKKLLAIKEAPIETYRRLAGNYPLDWVTNFSKRWEKDAG